MNFVLWQIAIITAVYVIALCATPVARAIVGHEPEAGRNLQLDGMRALAAIAVVACHLNQYMVTWLGFRELPLFGNQVGTLGVQIFFSITAYLFTDKAIRGNLKPIRFFVDRMRRIVPLYLFVCTLAIAYAAYNTASADDSFRQMVTDAAHVYSYGFWHWPELKFRDFNMLPLVGIAWTLNYEWAFYLLLVPAFYLWSSGRVARVVVVGTVAFLAYRDMSIAESVWPFFLPGVMAAFIKNRLPDAPRIGVILSILAAPSLALLLVIPGFWTPEKMILVGIVFLAVLYGRPRWLESRLLQTLGTISYSIYLMQYLVLFPVLSLPWARSNDIASKASLLGAVAVVTVLVAGVTYRFVELPWIKRRISPKNTASPRIIGADIELTVTGISDHRMLPVPVYAVHTTTPLK